MGVITPTTDYELVKSIITHEKVWDWVSDDYCNKDEFEVDISHMYLMADDVGFFALKPINSVCWEIHTTMLPEAWGRTLEYTKQVIEFIFSSTICQKIVTFVPENNKKALKLAEKSGLSLCGFVESSWLKNGELLGQYMLSIGKGDVCQ